MKKRLLSGITPTGDLTIGNYLGAIKQFVELQNEYEMFIFVANLHAIVLPINAEILQANTKKTMALYIACGLDVDKCNLFVQSDILEHANLAHIFLTNTTIGQLERMTQYKSKKLLLTQNQNTNITKTTNDYSIYTGILTYPTLMAADILLYNASVVPVGIDQKQHLELARDIAIKMNRDFKTKFVLPEPLISKETSKIMSLVDPKEKMSKSSTNEKSTIRLLDNPSLAYKKIMSAVTDSENKVYYDYDNKPGVSNLLAIYAGLCNKSIHEIEKLFKNMNYQEFKTIIAQKVFDFLKNLQKKYDDALKNVDDIRALGAKKVQQIATQSYNEIKLKIGLN